MKYAKKLLGIALVVMIFSACDKDNSSTDNDYLSDLIGTYSGEFSNQPGLSSSNKGTADIVLINDQLQIHCYGEYMDSTFVMDAFENGDSIMICDTGEAFEMQYGHTGNGGNHMMDMHNNESQWQHHMNDDHNSGETHYGGFDMNMHTFEYKFRMIDGDSIYFIMFNGSKN